MAAIGPSKETKALQNTDDHQVKLQIIKRVVKNSHNAQLNGLDVNPHIDINPLLFNEQLISVELDNFKSRWDKLAKILQQVLTTQEILKIYLDDPDKNKLLPESSAENLKYLREWCRDKFKREADFKAYQALLKETLIELYQHEGYLYNYSAQAILCAEIRRKFESLAAAPIDSKYLLMIFSTYQNLWMYKAKSSSGSTSEISQDQVSSSLHRSSSTDDFEVNVTTSFSLRTKGVDVRPPTPPPPPPIELFLARENVAVQSNIPVNVPPPQAFSLHTRTSINAKINNKMSAPEQAALKARDLRKKRKEKASAKNMTENDLLEQEERARLETPKANDTSEHLDAIHQRAAKMQISRNLKVSLKSLLDVTLPLRKQLDEAATYRSKKFVDDDNVNDVFDDRMQADPIEPKCADNTAPVYAKFFETQRRRASGSKVSDSDADSEFDDDWSDEDIMMYEKTHEKSQVGSNAQSSSAKQKVEDCDIDATVRLIQKLSLKLK